MKTGSVLFHWRFGPLIIEKIVDPYIYIVVEDPDGLNNTILEKIPKKIHKKYFDSFFFSNPQDIEFNFRINPIQVHEKIFPFLLNDINNRRKNTKWKNDIQLLKAINLYIESANRLKNSKRTKILILKIINRHKEIYEHLKQDFKINKSEIENITKTKTISPRELKVSYSKIPDLKLKNTLLLKKKTNATLLIKYYKNLLNQYITAGTYIDSEIKINYRNIISLLEE